MRWRSVAEVVVFRLANRRDPKRVREFRDDVGRAERVIHPGLVRIADLEARTGVFRVRFKAPPGISAWDVVEQNEHEAVRVSHGLALRIVHQAATALGEAHRLGLAHGRLVPDDVLLGLDGQVCVAGLGFSQAIRADREDSPGEHQARRGYVPPEQLVGRLKPTPAADVYALGTLLYELTTRRPLKRGDGVGAPAPSLCTKNYPMELEVVTLRALDPDPARRFPDGDAFAHALEQVAAALAIQPGSSAVSRVVRDLVQGHLSDEQGERSDNLPSSDGRLFGRREALESVLGWGKGEGRCLVLVGPPGAGKTRLAVEAARRLAGGFAGRGGTWLVDLSGCTGFRQACEALAARLGFVPEPKQDVRDLALRIGTELRRAGPTLLVMDAIEGVFAALAPMVVGWLAQAPTLRVIITSRQQLQISGAQAMGVLPLTAEAAASLFVFKARQARKGWQVAAGQIGYVETIVRQVDRLPGPILVMAAAIASKSLSGVLKELSETVGPALAGLAAPVYRSLDLLEDWERLALAQLSVLEGDFTAEAAGTIMDLRSLPDAPAPRVVLASIHRRSLLRVFKKQGKPSTLRLYRSVRDAARTRFPTAASLKAAVERHEHWFIRLTIGPPLGGGGSFPAWCKEVMDARAELRGIYRRSLRRKVHEPTSVNKAMRVAASLAWVEDPKRAIARLDRVLALVGQVPTEPVATAAAYIGRGMLLLADARLDEALADATRAGLHARWALEEELVTHANALRAEVLAAQGTPDRARELLSMALLGCNAGLPWVDRGFQLLRSLGGPSNDDKASAQGAN